MKKLTKVILLVFCVVLITACETKKEQIQKRLINEITINDEEINLVNEKNADAIKTQISRESKNTSKIKISNVSDFNIYNLKLQYEQLDGSDNVLSTQNVFLNMTLLPNECAYVNVNDNDTTQKRRIISYEYENNNKQIFVDLMQNKVDISNKKNKLDFNKEYDILQINSSYDVEKENYYVIKIKNSSNQDLGNVTLTVAQLNENGEYINITDFPIYEVIKSNREKQIKINLTKECKEVQITGYTYDLVNKMSKIKIDKKTDNTFINND